MLVFFSNSTLLVKVKKLRGLNNVDFVKTQIQCPLFERIIWWKGSCFAYIVLLKFGHLGSLLRIKHLSLLKSLCSWDGFLEVDFWVEEFEWLGALKHIAERISRKNDTKSITSSSISAHFAKTQEHWVFFFFLTLYPDGIKWHPGLIGTFNRYVK